MFAMYGKKSERERVKLQQSRKGSGDIEWQTGVAISPPHNTVMVILIRSLHAKYQILRGRGVLGCNLQFSTQGGAGSNTRRSSPHHFVHSSSVSDGGGPQPILCMVDRCDLNGALQSSCPLMCYSGYLALAAHVVAPKAKKYWQLRNTSARPLLPVWHRLSSGPAPTLDTIRRRRRK